MNLNAVGEMGKYWGRRRTRRVSEVVGGSNLLVRVVSGGGWERREGDEVHRR
jgi:hypothetical protein